jgi:hypothetical protein
MRSSFKPERLTEVRHRAADAAWQRVYSETFSRVYDETLAALLAEQEPEAAA